MKPIDTWKIVLRYGHSTRVQLVQLTLGAITAAQPATALWVWGMMPEPIVSRVPPQFVSAVGVVLFVLALASLVFRMIPQPKLQAKIQGATDAKPDC